MPRQAKVSKRADGNYCRSIVVGRKPDGKPIRKYIYAKTIKELDRRAGEYEQKKRYGTLPSDENATFGELASVWIKEYKPTVGVNTRRMYEALLNQHLLPELKNVRLLDLKKHHLQSIINGMAASEYSTKTMRECKHTAAQVLSIAVDNDLLYRNVFLSVDIPEVEAEERRALRPDEISLVTDTYAGHRMGLPVMLMLYCGLRRGELLALTWGDIDLNRKMLTVNKAVYVDSNQTEIKAPKTKAGTRQVPIPDFMIPILHGKRSSSILVCPSARGGRMTQSAFKSAWNSYQRYLNLSAGGTDQKRGRNTPDGKHTVIPSVLAVEPFTAHQLRHTYASMLYDAGVDVKSAQKFLGHADIETTLRIYTHLSEEKEQQAIDAINAHFGARKNADAVKMR